ncbi:MAG: TIGR00159 family protein [Phycisphaerae bacterium]|nr:TIGR00159 family protein [Phycisphaerae bacterium]NIP51661.1 TIGR00159 family protein [Phycisphaerae bacterium]NIS50771.1 TIGR00159 family protein [Phycisphaerae bacterium]NIU08522.1 TIGR00159 family protein [Phycisphaerae bacterium]NIU57804.1 TIGR00159 family protein [Phycisphaerae bacterium]
MDTLLDYFYRVAGYEWWRVVIEFFLIGLVVYWVVDFLEGTRGERLFRSVIFILIAGVLILNLVAEQLRFERLEYLYRGFLIGVLVIAVAAFQPEIRRALIRIGQPRFWASSSQQLVKTVEEMVTAVTELSAARTGAIIVIEKRVALGEFIETGVRIDARVTSELLKTIFHPGTALHDMAVIIRGDRVVAARVQLPLAEAGSIDGVELGSRHRAAIGITAGSDAACLVVSEETGVITLARKGKLTRDISESQLRKSLTSTMAEYVPFVERLWGHPGKEPEQEHKDLA